MNAARMGVWARIRCEIVACVLGWRSYRALREGMLARHNVAYLCDRGRFNDPCSVCDGVRS